mgnify:CR=1 FL=1
MRQQLVDPAGRMRGQALQHVLEVRIRLVPVGARRMQKAHDCGGPLARTQAAGKSQFALPSAMCLMGFSTQLLEIGTSPSSTKRVISPQRLRL